jgi:Domain of unknown function (DUF4173)
LLAFNALFALQNGMDIAWLWGIVPLPEGITLAQYAHRGALAITDTLTTQLPLRSSPPEALHPLQIPRQNVDLQVDLIPLFQRA